MDIGAYRKIVSDYVLSIDRKHRKEHAQFFTPYPIANFMVNWVLSGGRCSSFLDPAVGLGIFPAIAQGRVKKMVGYDIDDKILSFGRKAAIYGDMRVEQTNYLDSGDEKFDGIVCNPPYKKIQDSADAKRQIPIIGSQASIPLCGLTNLCVLFLVKSILQLSPRGRCAFIIPSEFMNADYGVEVKRFLIEQGALCEVIVFDFSKNIFDDALTTACVLLFDNRKAGKVRFFCLRDINEYDSSKAVGEYDIKTLLPEKKWRSYYKPSKHSFSNVTSFSKWAKVSRGIATGANDFFLFNRTKQKEYSIPAKALLPCVSSAKDVGAGETIFSDRCFKKLVSANKKVFLFDANGAIDDPNVLRYIKIGEDNGVPSGYLTSHRDPWYAIEKKAPAPIWVSVFNRKALRFIWNEARLASLTPFHQVYLSPQMRGRAELFFAYLQTKACSRLLEQNCREYGNGLKKFEPNDINNAMTVDFDTISAEQEKEILSVFRDYLETKDEQLLDNIDDIFTEILQKPVSKEYSEAEELPLVFNEEFFEGADKNFF